MTTYNRALGVGWTDLVLPDGTDLVVRDDLPYQVHASGKVRNADTGRELTPYARGGATGDQYLAVELTSGPRAPGQVYVHQLVGWAFVAGWDPSLQIEHLDGDPHHNHQANLRWVEPSENLEGRG